MTDPAEFRHLLRGLPVFAAPLPTLDPDEAGDDPRGLFIRWIEEAIAAGVREPHAMSLATVDGNGRPNARVLIVKDVTPDEAWRFAGSRVASKGDELAACPAAAATFYWPTLGRQVRLRGPVREAGREASTADFLARGAGARAESLAGRQSQTLDPAEVAPTLAAAEALLRDDPGRVADHWRVWEIVADEVEFFQGDADRRHTRLVFSRDGGGWSRRLLWP